MNYEVKMHMGLALLCASYREIPIGESANDADGKIELKWDGEKLTFRVIDPEFNVEYFSCEMLGLPTLEAAENILRSAFSASLVDVPEKTIAAFKEEYERG